MTLPRLFVYGTLRDDEILAAVLGRNVSAHDRVDARAPDCAAVYFPDQLYPALVRRRGSVAPGVVLTGITADDLAALDAFEGDQYRREALEVVTATGAIEAQAYWPTVPVPPSARDWTLERWLREHEPHRLRRETRLALAARLGSAKHWR